MARAIVTAEPESVALADVQLPPLGEGQLRLRTRCTLLSTGTETTILHRRFAAGTHWARMFARPRPLGYSCVAEVTEVADGAGSAGSSDSGGGGGTFGPGRGSAFARGDRVVAQLAHASEHVVDAARCTPIPDEVSDQDAAWFALAKVAYVAADVSGAGLGTRTLVVGGGPVGQMAIRWLAAQGAYVVTAERRTTIRTALARAGGAAEVRRTDQLPGLAAAPERLSESEPEAPGSGSSRSGSGGSGPGGSGLDGSGLGGSDRRGSTEFEVVVDATGNPAAFSGALRVASDHGRVVVLGDVGDPSEQRLTSDLITRGLSVVGAHGNHVRGEREHQVRRLFFRLVSNGRFPMAGLVTHRFAPEQCAEAYALVEHDRANSLGVLFDWRS